MNSNKTLNLEKVNCLSKEEFVDFFGNIVENNSEAAEQVSLKRPYTSINDMENALSDYLHQLNNCEKENILSNHPQLKGQIPKEKLTVESTNEQTIAGISRITDTEKSELMKLNKLYKEKFSFPFVICARENNVSSILSTIKRRLENQKDVEANNGIEEVIKISRLRIRDLIINQTAINN